VSAKNQRVQPAPAAAAEFQEGFNTLRDEIRKAVLGQDEIVEMVLAAFFAGGHVLLEGEPGMGKTHLVKALSRALGLPWKRIQFTPDLMPADILGTHILIEDERGNRKLEFKRGPIFTHVLLADEVNRATPKTQAALLEAMGEGQVTIQGTTHRLPETFFVIATQNPLENEGTYPLPEAQLDRFFFKLIVAPPAREALQRIVVETTDWREAPRSASGAADPAAGFLARPGTAPPPPRSVARPLHEVVTEGVLSKAETTPVEEDLAAGIGSGEELRSRILAIREEKLLGLRRKVRQLEIDATALDALADILEVSRVAELRVTPEGDVLGDLVRAGLGPRAAQALALAGKVAALRAGARIVLPEHLDGGAAAAALAHRLPLQFAAERLGPHAGVKIVQALLGVKKGARAHAVVAN